MLLWNSLGWPFFVNMLISSRLALNRFWRIYKYLIVRLLTLIYYCKRLRISVFWRSSNFEHFAPPLPRDARTDPKRPSVGAEQWAGSISRAAQWLDSVVGTRCCALPMVCGARMAQRFKAQRCNGAGLSVSYPHAHARRYWSWGAAALFHCFAASVHKMNIVPRGAMGHCSIDSLLLFTKWTKQVFNG